MTPPAGPPRLDPISRLTYRELYDSLARGREGELCPPLSLALGFRGKTVADQGLGKVNMSTPR